MAPADGRNTHESRSDATVGIRSITGRESVIVGYRTGERSGIGREPIAARAARIETGSNPPGFEPWVRSRIVLGGRPLDVDPVSVVAVRLDGHMDLQNAVPVGRLDVVGADVPGDGDGLAGAARPGVLAVVDLVGRVDVEHPVRVPEVGLLRLEAGGSAITTCPSSVLSTRRFEPTS